MDTTPKGRPRASTHPSPCTGSSSSSSSSSSSHAHHNDPSAPAQRNPPTTIRPRPRRQTASAAATSHRASAAKTAPLLLTPKHELLKRFEFRDSDDDDSGGDNAWPEAARRRRGEAVASASASAVSSSRTAEPGGLVGEGAWAGGLVSERGGEAVVRRRRGGAAARVERHDSADLEAPGVRVKMEGVGLGLVGDEGVEGEGEERSPPSPSPWYGQVARLRRFFSKGGTAAEALMPGARTPEGLEASEGGWPAAVPSPRRASLLGRVWSGRKKREAVQRAGRSNATEEDDNGEEEDGDDGEQVELLDFLNQTRVHPLPASASSPAGNAATETATTTMTTAFSRATTDGASCPPTRNNTPHHRPPPPPPRPVRAAPSRQTRSLDHPRRPSSPLAHRPNTHRPRTAAAAESGCPSTGTRFLLRSDTAAPNGRLHAFISRGRGGARSEPDLLAAAPPAAAELEALWWGRSGRAWGPTRLGMRVLEGRDDREGWWRWVEEREGRAEAEGREAGERRLVGVRARIREWKEGCGREAWPVGVEMVEEGETAGSVWSAEEVGEEEMGRLRVAEGWVPGFEGRLLRRKQRFQARQERMAREREERERSAREMSEGGETSEREGDEGGQAVTVGGPRYETLVASEAPTMGGAASSGGKETDWVVRTDAVDVD
ncbi:hypothetical protein NpPPO83_00007544 [Neofusicoccum parvum]|uniref:Uncharacterized protein n=1 Tax=Neofusicoccum parvum TaxID=310453 RepID=A0ACB5S5W7_9PEZI|nr:hypothetical protein NpPPO83_00007544 [Neofusicoccum parvum]